MQSLKEKITQAIYSIWARDERLTGDAEERARRRLKARGQKSWSGFWRSKRR